MSEAGKVNCLERIKKAVLGSREETMKIYFGLTKEEISEIEYILQTVRLNPDSNSTPDFVFDNGFIDSFDVSSLHITYHSNNYLNTPDCILPEETEIHDYKYLYARFKDDWKEHINLCKNRIDLNQTGIFMIEYPEAKLCMYERQDDYSLALEKGISTGDISGVETIQDYRISRDIRILEYILKNSNGLKYVFFCNQTNVEIFSIKNIYMIISLLPAQYIIRPWM